MCALIAVCITSTACSKPTKFSIRDTENRAFEVSCLEGKCDLTSTETASPTTPKPDGAKPGFALRQASRIYAACEVWMKGSTPGDPNISDCRALVCKSDADCPPAKGLTHGSCTNGLCIEPSGSITSDDSVVLCMAGTGRPENNARQIERFALGNNCGSPCKVPTVCRQP